MWRVRIHVRGTGSTVMYGQRGHVPDMNTCLLHHDALLSDCYAGYGVDESAVCVPCAQGTFSVGWELVVTETVHEVYCESCPSHSTNTGTLNSRCAGELK